jgi:hypothetical protein
LLQYDITDDATDELSRFILMSLYV